MSWNEEVAWSLREAHRLGLDFVPLRTGGQPLDERDAYDVQAHLVARLRADTESDLAGYKIGLTSAAMQQMCGVSAPVYGCMLNKQIHSGDASIDLARYGHLGIEFEIAVRLGKDVNTAPATWSGIGDFVDAIAPAFELIDDRHAVYTQLDGASLIADNAWSAGAVFGAWQDTPADLRARRGRIFCDGTQVDAGRVGDALEHPFASVHWLATELLRSGRLLRAGLVVMTGSIVRTRFPVGGQHWRYEVDGLGSVQAVFTH